GIATAYAPVMRQPGRHRPETPTLSDITRRRHDAEPQLNRTRPDLQQRQQRRGPLVDAHEDRVHIRDRQQRPTDRLSDSVHRMHDPTSPRTTTTARHVVWRLLVVAPGGPDPPDDHVTLATGPTVSGCHRRSSGPMS